ncbi:hypothetical protein SAMN05660830_02452 [Halodesulfovibrio aestuarii]|uniref:Uncharacterized protein n=1 Tax=Halodesulfovibrio aestuarii TaxID=126333 RepID=A0A8G2CAZ9_9BACT|nr:hypothetical protein SAMN05660830_02452 [Halodesulfovibrio aestuarii]
MRMSKKFPKTCFNTIIAGILEDCTACVEAHTLDTQTIALCGSQYAGG